MSKKSMWKTAHHKPQVVPAVSAVLAAGALVEMVCDPGTRRTAFAVWQDGTSEHVDKIEDVTGRVLVPYGFDNALMRSNVLRFPTQAEDYGSEGELIDEVRAFIHRYVGLSDGFELVASYYVLFTWLHDGFNELPYLRVRGDYGTGKTRFLQTIGSICYHPIFACGASTLSPIFHMLDLFGGTLIIDEADFRLSDETADMVKMLNNGNVRGMPILRSQITRQREFEPRVFQVFGPKIVATRGHYSDRGLESRFITENMSTQSLRKDIPLNLSEAHEQEALALRNKLLMYRFRNFGRRTPHDVSINCPIEPRLHQVLAPLLSIIDDEDDREEILRVVRRDPVGTAVALPGHDANDYIWIPCA